MIRMSVPEAFAISRRFTHASTSVRPTLERRVGHFAARLETKIKAKASGRPGPRVQTGDYRRSITRERITDIDFTGWIVGTNAPQARRLEFGFVGADSLGRVYDQPPYPHFGPALDEMRPVIEKGLDDVVHAIARVVVA